MYNRFSYQTIVEECFIISPQYTCFPPLLCFLAKWQHLSREISILCIHTFTIKQGKSK
uniref:Uncharacterized protein n=1 Tax=virus sp. ctPYc18 TaxID=2828251 RepID=A0A8S5RD96_9VIRU|nr:MAG TPA: hypothetical protein [virus sp. ctPYc18]